MASGSCCVQAGEAFMPCPPDTRAPAVRATCQLPCIPRLNAITLIRPRSSGVTSSVSRAVWTVPRDVGPEVSSWCTQALAGSAAGRRPMAVRWGFWDVDAAAISIISRTAGPVPRSRAQRRPANTSHASRLPPRSRRTQSVVRYRRAASKRLVGERGARLTADHRADHAPVDHEGRAAAAGTPGPQ